jgi:hypothetical protein
MQNLDINTLLAMQPEHVVACARHSLRQVSTPALDIYNETGLTPAWQQAFSDGRSKDPAYTRMVRLIDWLIKKNAFHVAPECLIKQ